MEMNRRSKQDFRLLQKNHPVTGIIATCFAVGSLFFTIALLFLTYRFTLQKRGIGYLLPLCAMSIFAFSFAGTCLGLTSLKKKEEKEIYYRYPLIGVVGNGGICIGYVLLYLWGIYQF